MTTTPTDVVQEAETLLATITPGEWQVHHDCDVTGYPCFFIHGMSGDEKRNGARLHADAEFLAAAPRLVRALLDEVGFLHVQAALAAEQLQAVTQQRDAMREQIATIEQAMREEAMSFNRCGAAHGNRQVEAWVDWLVAIRNGEDR